MSEVLTLTVEALVPLRHKAVNGCLVLLDVVVGSEYCLPLRASLGDQKWRNRRESGLDYTEGDREHPT